MYCFGFPFVIKCNMSRVVLQEILMDHCLRMISYIADIGDILVVMARRDPQVCSSGDDNGAASQRRMQNKICCHVFESPDVRVCC